MSQRNLGDEPSPARIILPIKPVAKLLAVTASGRVALIRWEFAGQQPGSLDRFLPTALEGDRLCQPSAAARSDG